jgi:RNA polymerase sigma factor (sigma-70 family)
MSYAENDTSWISLVITGDRRSINNFVEIYGSFMYNVCYKILLSPEEAEEAAHDAILKAVKAIRLFDHKASFKAWCYTIAYRTAIDYKRKIRYTLPLDISNDVASGQLSDQNIQQNEIKSALESLLSQLDDESKMIISLYYLEEKNIKEVSKIMGLTDSNIKIKLFRARKEMAIHAPKYFEHI